MPPAWPGRYAAASGSEIKRKKSLPSGLDRPDIRPCAVIVTLRLAPLNMRIASRSATSRSAKALFELSSGIAASTMSDSWASYPAFFRPRITSGRIARRLSALDADSLRRRLGWYAAGPAGVRRGRQPRWGGFLPAGVLWGLTGGAESKPRRSIRQA
jgi:hypothetical protein